jgi:chromosome segregation ATPase
MSSELRSTTFQLEFKGQDGITGIRQFTRAVSDADQIVDELSKSLGDNTKVTYKNVRSKKELLADARRLVSQIEKTKSKVSELTRMYAHQSLAVNKTADEQEVLNAVYRLGAHATNAQKDEVTKLVTNYQKLRQSTSKTQKSFRNLRGMSQNLGWQLQDVAVQAQMGTSAFVIFSQQGSQMASSVGPAGAIVGAFIAVGGALTGALMPALFNSSKLVKELTERMEEWKKTIGLTAEQIELLTDKEIKKNKEIKKSIESRDKEIASYKVSLALGQKTIDQYKDESGFFTKLALTRSGFYKTLTVTQDSINKKINEHVALRKTEQDQLDKSSKKVKSYQDSLNRG